MRKLFVFLPLLAALSILVPQPADAQGAGDGLKIKEIAVGDGDAAQRHSKVTVHYTGWLIDGKKFDSSLDRGKPFDFIIGLGQVIGGWEQGLIGMKVGGKRELIVPPELGYGARGAGDAIPPNATLRFEVELLGVDGPAYVNLDTPGVAERLVAGARLVDIRGPEEWAETGVIDGSKRLTAFDSQGRFVKNFPPEFEKLVAKMDEVIIVSGGGVRSSLIALALTRQAGYARVFNAAEGISGWVAAGRPIAK